MDWGDHVLRGALQFWFLLISIADGEVDDVRELEAGIHAFFGRGVTRLTAEAWNREFYRIKYLYKKKKFEDADKLPVPVLDVTGQHSFGRLGALTAETLQQMGRRFRGTHGKLAPKLRAALVPNGDELAKEVLQNILVFHTHFYFSKGIIEAAPLDVYRVLKQLEGVLVTTSAVHRHYEQLYVIPRLFRELRSKFPCPSLRWRIVDYPVFDDRTEDTCPMKFWARIPFHGYECLDDGNLIRSLIVVPVPCLNPCNVRQSLMREIFQQHILISRGHKRRDVTTALLTLQGSLKLIGQEEDTKQIDVPWTAAVRVTEVTEAMVKAVLCHFEPVHDAMCRALVHYVDRYDTEWLTMLRAHLLEQKVTLNKHMEEFLVEFEIMLEMKQDVVHHKHIMDRLRRRCLRMTTECLTRASERDSSSSG